MQVRKGELAILSQASRWVVQLLGRLEEGDDDEDDGEADSGTEADSGSEPEAQPEVNLQPGTDRSAKRARTSL